MLNSGTLPVQGKKTCEMAGNLDFLSDATRSPRAKSVNAFTIFFLSRCIHILICTDKYSNETFFQFFIFSTSLREAFSEQCRGKKIVLEQISGARFFTGFENHALFFPALWRKIPM